jgi:hypothetical protein
MNMTKQAQIDGTFVGFSCVSTATTRDVSWQPDSSSEKGQRRNSGYL